MRNLLLLDHFVAVPVVLSAVIAGRLGLYILERGGPLTLPIKKTVLVSQAGLFILGGTPQSSPPAGFAKRIR